MIVLHLTVHVSLLHLLTCRHRLRLLAHQNFQSAWIRDYCRPCVILETNRLHNSFVINFFWCCNYINYSNSIHAICGLKLRNRNTRGISPFKMDYLYPCMLFVWVAYLWETYLQWRQVRSSTPIYVTPCNLDISPSYLISISWYNMVLM